MTSFRSHFFAIATEHVPQLLAGPAARAAIKRPASPGAIGIFGVLGSSSDWFSDSSYEDIRAGVRRALADPSTKTIDLVIDSPGGSVLGLPETASTIHEANRIKPVRAFVPGIAASAAYWLASQASTISLTPSGEAGSVGVIDLHADVSGALALAGVKVTAVTAGEHKAERAPFAPLSDGAQAHMQKGVDAWYGDFLSAVRRGRGSRVSPGSTFGGGRMLSAREALAAGLVDFIGGAM